MQLQADTAQLVLVDFQEKLMPAIAQGQEVLLEARRLAQLAQWFEVPVFASEQNPLRLGHNDAEIASRVQKTFSKMDFSACAASGLLQALQAEANPAPPRTNNGGGNSRSLPKHLQKKQASATTPRDQILLAGCEAHVCLLQTALDLLEEDWEVWVVSNACGSRRSVDKDAALDRLAANGAELVTLEMVAFEWLGSAEHPRFKEVHALIK